MYTVKAVLKLNDCSEKNKGLSTFRQLLDDLFTYSPSYSWCMACDKYFRCTVYINIILMCRTRNYDIILDTLYLCRRDTVMTHIYGLKAFLINNFNYLSNWDPMCID